MSASPVASTSSRVGMAIDWVVAESKLAGLHLALVLLELGGFLLIVCQ